LTAIPVAVPDGRDQTAKQPASSLRPQNRKPLRRKPEYL